MAWDCWAGTILDVNLTSGEIIKKPLTKDMAVNYIGGSGFAAKILYDELKPGIDPLGPDNISMVTQGTLGGTMAPSCGRYTVITKSPQTGIHLRSNGGGYFGPELKWAGYDLIIIRGKSKTPVYLWIKDDHVELRDASHLWGKDTWETERLIRDELGDAEIKTLKIGPSGEHEGISSCIIGDLSRAAGKGAGAAVWGSKKLKAIAVRGSKEVNIAKREEFKKLCMALEGRITQDPVYDLHSRLGTPSWVSDPIIRASLREWPGLLEGLFVKEFDKTIFDKSLACFNCPMHCSHWYTNKDSKYKSNVGEGLEGNAVIYGGCILRVNSAAFVAKYNTLCNQLGLHMDNPGCAIAWATELYQDGIITKDDTDDIELSWGNEETILKFMHKIAYREGFGDILDAYPLGAAQKLGKGSLPYASHMKGMTSRGPGITLSTSFILATSVATRGRDHLIGTPMWCLFNDVEGIREHVVKFGEKVYGDGRLTGDLWWATPKKAVLVYDTENIHAICDMTGICKFASIMAMFTTGYQMEDFAAVLSAATGVPFTTEDMVKAAEREMLLERAFNAREGIRRIDDYPTVWYWQKKYNEPHPRYKDKKFPLTLEQYDEMLDEYYRLRGCDLETGAPRKEKLEELGLNDVAEDLVKREIIR